MSTTVADRTAHSDVDHPSAAFGTSVGRTTRGAPFVASNWISSTSSACGRRGRAWQRRPPRRALASELGYPVLVRPHHVLGGRRMRVAYAPAELELDEPALVDEFLAGAIELDVDALCDGKSALVAAGLEHVERAGGRTLAARLAGRLGARGLLDLQLALHGGEPYVLEASPRASRTVPFALRPRRRDAPDPEVMSEAATLCLRTAGSCAPPAGAAPPQVRCARCSLNGSTSAPSTLVLDRLSGRLEQPPRRGRGAINRGYAASTDPGPSTATLPPYDGQAIHEQAERGEPPRVDRRDPARLSMQGNSVNTTSRRRRRAVSSLASTTGTLDAYNLAGPPAGDWALKPTVA
jgi:hypothetical protein